MEILIQIIGRFLRVLIFVAVLAPSAFSQEAETYVPDTETLTWKSYASEIRQRTIEDRKQGISYVISGAVAYLGGWTGAEMIKDPIEKGAYNIIQTVGLASLSYGIYTWKVGDKDRQLFKTMLHSDFLTQKQKTDFLRLYYTEQRARDETLRWMRVAAHGLIGLQNIYSATRQENGTLQSVFYFVGGINILASASLVFSF